MDVCSSANTGTSTGIVRYRIELVVAYEHVPYVLVLYYTELAVRTSTTELAWHNMQQQQAVLYGTVR